MTALLQQDMKKNQKKYRKGIVYTQSQCYIMCVHNKWTGGKQK